MPRCTGRADRWLLWVRWPVASDHSGSTGWLHSGADTPTNCSSLHPTSQVHCCSCFCRWGCPPRISHACPSPKYQSPSCPCWPGQSRSRLPVHSWAWISQCRLQVVHPESFAGHSGWRHSLCSPPDIPASDLLWHRANSARSPSTGEWCSTAQLLDQTSATWPDWRRSSSDPSLHLVSWSPKIPNK